MPTTIKPHDQGQDTKRLVNTLQFDSINEPGTYVCNWSGHLMRVPEDAVKQGRSPVVDLIATEPLTVTRISDNPFIPLTKARMLAADYDLNVGF